MPDSPATATGGVVADAGTYTVTMTKLAGHSNPKFAQENLTMPEVRNGTDFQFEMKVEGSAVLQSDHIGGHFGLNTSASPSKTTYPIPCNHVKGVLPLAYTITCTAPKATGVYHIRGHAQVTQGDKVSNWWSDDFVFRVT